MILSRPRIIAQARLDLEDWNLLLSAGRTDSKLKVKQFESSSNYVLKGFGVTGLGAKTATVTMTDATLIIPEGTSDFSWFTAEPGAAAITITDAELTDNTRNYVEMSLVNTDGTPLTKAFWSPEAVNGAGAEFNQITNTVTELSIQFSVSIGGFTGSPNALNLCIIDTDSSGTITAIFDERDLFYRLATTSDLDNDFAWGTKQESLFTMTLTGGAGTYVAGEIITMNGITATVITGGTTSIAFNCPTGKTFSKGNTCVGGTSGASRTIATISEAFTGVDKSIANNKQMFDAIMTEIKSIKNKRFWWMDADSSLVGLRQHLESFMIQNVDGAKFTWNGSVLSISDAAGVPADADVVGKIKIPGSSQLLNLTREDGTGGSSTIAIAEGQIMYVELPATGDRTYSASGSGSTNYKVAAIASYLPSDTNYWIAYRELSKLYVRGYGELQSGETAYIGDPVNPQILAFIGATSETDATPAYSSNIRGTASENLTTRAGKLTAAIGDSQEDRSAYIRSDNQVSWSGTNLVFTADIVLEIINTKTGVLKAANIAVASSPIVLANNECAWVLINRTAATETLTVNLSGTTPVPAQTEANKDVFIIARRKDAGGYSYLHIPLHKQVLEPGQTVRLGASASGSGGGGAKNYITGGDAEAGISGFVTYNDAAATRPVNGIDGTAVITFATSADTSLSDANVFALVKDATNRQGDGVSVPFTIDAANQAKVLQISFDYLVGSGTFVAGTSTADSDVIAYIYDVTNAVLIEPSSFKLLSNSTTIADKFSATFQTASNSTSYRLILHVASVSALAYTLKLDNITVSPSVYPTGTPITDWQSYTPTTTGIGTPSNEGTYWRRVGDSLEIKATIVAGTVDATALSISLPSGLSIDASKNPSTADTASHGVVYRINASIADAYATAAYGPWVAFSDTAVSASVLYVAQDQVTSRFSKDSANELLASSDRFRITASGIPILGWGASTQMSSETDTRVVAARVSNAAGTSLVNAAETLLPFATVGSDSHGGWSTSTNRYTISVAGKYRLSANARLDAAAGWAAGESFYLVLRKNGTTDFARGINTASATHTSSVAVNVSGQHDFVAGDYIEVIYFQNSGAAITLITSSLDNRFELERISGPSAIAASESVNARYYSSTTTITSTLATILYATKSWDTHGTYNATTGIFTAGIAGKYQVNASIAMTGTFVLNSILDLQVQQTGSASQVSETKAYAGGGVTQMNANLGDIFYMIAGDTLKVQASNTGTLPVIAATNTQNWISFSRVGN